MPRQIHYQNPTSCYDFLHTLGTVVAWTATCFAVFAPPALLVMTNGSSRVQFGIQSLACPTLRMADEATLKYNLEQYWCSRDHLDAKEFIGLAGSKLRVLEVIALCAILSSMFASRAASCITFGMLGYLVFLWADQIPDKRSNFDVQPTFWVWLLPSMFGFAEACRFSISKLVSKQYWSELGPSGGHREPDGPYHNIHHARDVALDTAVGWKGLPSDVIAYASERIQDSSLAILGAIAIQVLVVAQDIAPLYVWVLLSGLRGAINFLSIVLTCSFARLGWKSGAFDLFFVLAASVIALSSSFRDAIEWVLTGKEYSQISQYVLVAVGLVIIAHQALVACGVASGLMGVFSLCQCKSNARSIKRR